MKSSTARQQIFAAISAERDRQDRIHPNTSQIPDGTGSLERRILVSFARDERDRAAREGRLTYAHILDEETAEVLAETDPAKLRVELLQVAAVCVKWCEEIDRREGR